MQTGNWWCQIFNIQIDCFLNLHALVAFSSRQ